GQATAEAKATPGRDNATVAQATNELLQVGANRGTAGAIPPEQQVRSGLGELAWIAFYDILVFFGVLLVGFAYLWKRGDINWVRSMAAEKEDEAEVAPPPPPAEPVGSQKTIMDGSLQTISH